MKRGNGIFYLLVIVIGLGFANGNESRAQSDDDKKQVERACLDYVEAVYYVKPELIDRSVHRELKKFGFYYNQRDKNYSSSHMTFDQLRKLASNWNKSGRIGEDAMIKKVEVLDVLDKTAVAKLTAAWGVDYFQLIKEDDKWMIYQIIWQSLPKKDDDKK